MKKGMTVVIIVLFFPALLRAEAKPVVGINPFVIRGLSPEEGRIIESLIHSYISVVGEVVINAGNRGDGSAGTGTLIYAEETGPPDFILSGSIGLENDSHILVLEITNTRIGETLLYSSSHRTTGELLLKVRTMVETLFSAESIKGGESPADIREDEPELITEGNITGTWRGDTGIEIIRLRQGGRGIAIFSSGAQMNLAYTIENNVLKVAQNSPNTERFYHPVPYGVAKQLAGEAEPMRWELLLYRKGTSLKGIKVTTAVRYEGDKVLEFLHGTTREAEWTRATR
jgi:hypothetical protein